MEAPTDASRPGSGSEPPPPTPAEQPQEAEIRGGGEATEDEVLISKAQKLMNMITSSQENPSPKALHALASILETQETRYIEENGHSSPNNARSSHSIGRLANLVRENDDFFELISSKFLSETGYSMAVQAAASRLLLSCSPTWMYPHVFDEDVLENVKDWVVDDSARSLPNQSQQELGMNKPSDFEMRRTYATGLLAVCLTGAGQLLEEVLTSGLSAKLMHYLRVRVLGETSANQQSHASENRGVNAVGGRGRDDDRGRMKQSLETIPFDGSRTPDKNTGKDDENVTDQHVHGEEGCINGQHHDSFAQEDHEYDSGANIKLKDGGDSVRGDSNKCKMTRGPRSKERIRANEGVPEGEQSLFSRGAGGRLGQSHITVDKTLLKTYGGKTGADTIKGKIREVAEGYANETEDNNGRFQDCKVGSRDISDLVKSAVRAAEAEARAADAPIEAVKAAGDAAAELVKSAAIDEFKTTNNEDAAVLAASRAASTVIDAAVSVELSRNANAEEGADAEGVDVSTSTVADTESIEDIVDVMIPGCESLAQQREKFCVQCLVILGEYIEVLGPVMQEKGVDVCLALLQKCSRLKDETEAAILLSDVLKLINALAAHKKFAALFVDRGGMQKLLSVPRALHTFFGLSSCLFTIGSLQGVMEHVCTLPSNIVLELVKLGLQLLECPQDQARKNAALFFAAVFPFRAILDAFDAVDGLQKVLGLLHEAASVRSGVNPASLAPSGTGSLRNDRSNAEVLTSSEKQIAYHTTVALRQYFRAQLLLLVDSVRPNKSSRSAARNIPSVRAAYKPLDISNEAMEAVLLQIQKDRKLGPAFARVKWSAVDKFLACNGHVTMLELCQAPPVERYLHDLLQYALGVLHIVTLVPYSRKLVVTATLSNNRVGIAVIMDAASGTGCSDPEIIQQALCVLVNLVCPPPSISNKPLQLTQGHHSVSIQSSTGPGTDARERNSEQNATDRVFSTPSQSETRDRNGEAVQTPVSAVASGLVGDRRISLGAGAGLAGLAAQLEQGYRQARDAVRSNSGIKILLQLIQTRIVAAPAVLDCLRALACRVLLGLARDETIAHILTKLQVGKKLSELIRDISSQTPGTEQSRWQIELTQVSLELIAIVTNSGRASTIAATDAATPTLRRIERAAIAAATPISYHSRELLLLIHEHLQACGLGKSANTLLKEAQLTPLPSLSAPSSLAYNVSAQESSSLQIQWPSGRSSAGFLSTGLKSMPGHDDSQKIALDSSVKKKPLVFSSTQSASRSQNPSGDPQTPNLRKLHGSSNKPFGSTSAAGKPTASAAKSVAEAETQGKTPIVLPMKRKSTELKETSSASVKRLNTGDQGLRSPIFQTPGSIRRNNLFDPASFSTPVSGSKDFLGRRADGLDDNCETPAAPSQSGFTADIQTGGTERLSLDSIVVQYLKHQHRQCPAPITTLPALSLLQPHVCPEPKRSLDAPSNMTARLSTREYRSMYGGTHGNRRDRHFVYSRFKPMRTCRDDASSLLTCMSFLKDYQIAAGFHSGELKIFDTFNNTVVETSLSHQSPVTMVQSYFGDETQLVLTSSSFDVKLWDASSISGGPIHSFDECRTAKFGNEGNVFAALPLEPSQRDVLLYDVRTAQLDQKLSDSSASSSGRSHSYSLVHFSPTDTMLLWNGVLWDRRVSGPVHRFDQFTDYGGGGFHPAGNELIINSEVWDLRKFRLLRSVPSLDQTVITFNGRGDVIYATLRRNLDDPMSAVRRTKHPLFATFRTLDAVNYSDIATVPVDRCVLDFAAEPTDSVVGLVTLDDPADMFSSARVYEIGRRRPLDDDSDPDDGEDSEDDDEEDDDDMDGDPILGPILEGDGDSGNEGDMSDDDDDGGSELDGDEDDLDDDDDEDGDFFIDAAGLGGGGGMIGMMTDGDEDDDSDEDGMLDSYSSDDDGFFGNIR